MSHSGLSSNPFPGDWAASDYYVLQTMYATGAALKQASDDLAAAMNAYEAAEAAKVAALETAGVTQPTVSLAKATLDLGATISLVFGNPDTPSALPAAGLLLSAVRMAAIFDRAGDEIKGAGISGVTIAAESWSDIGLAEPSEQTAARAVVARHASAVAGQLSTLDAVRARGEWTTADALAIYEAQIARHAAELRRHGVKREYSTVAMRVSDEEWRELNAGALDWSAKSTAYLFNAMQATARSAAAVTSAVRQTSTPSISGGGSLGVSS